MQLRPYQSAAVDALLASFERRGKHNPLVVVPTGGGKSAILAGFLDRALSSSPESRALVLAHRKELLEQDARAIQRFAPSLDVGIYSAGLGLRQPHRRVVVGGIQSVANHLDAIGARDLVIVDEAHLVPHGDDGTYRDVLAALDNPATVGLTATPYRLSGGHLCRGKGKLFSHVAHEVSIAELLALGHLSPLVSVSGDAQYDTSDVSVSGGDFKAKDLTIAVGLQPKITERALAEAMKIIDREKREHVLVFAVGVDHAREVVQALFAMGVGARVVTGDTDAGERARTIDAFKRGELRVLVNVDVLTTGFDAPCTDAIVMLRPTQSTGLYVQILGRGMRPSPESGKVNCLVLDYAGNIARHGPVDAVKPKSQGASGPGAAIHEACGAEIPSRAAVCPECGEMVDPRMCKKCGLLQRRDRRECQDCGADLRTPREVEHDEKAARLSVMGGDAARAENAGMEWSEPAPVARVTYMEHRKAARGPDGEEIGQSVSVRVDYHGAMRKIASEWVCPEHIGFAAKKARTWWAEHGGAAPIPVTVADFLARAPAELREVKSIRTAPDPKSPKYTRVGCIEYGERPPVIQTLAEAAMEPAKSEYDEWIDGAMDSAGTAAIALDDDPPF